MKLSTALFRLARECCSALLIALMLLSSVAQARLLARHEGMAGGPARFASCTAISNQEAPSSDSIPTSDAAHGCMQCCLASTPVLPGLTAIGLLQDWVITPVFPKASGLPCDAMFLVQEARGPPVM